ncbi:Egg cell-secreted protein 1.1 [Thalictrum thalictroides]|uniref:Egg cell-secreted protein 1.1 n=1 Tax=Thalictrum thalictroides TaxID=46969 RepID=A0A7J6XFH3_THATH|nr:Egg cell-secreted protein 1.1 [Thalictrum thalictroides]
MALRKCILLLTISFLIATNLASTASLPNKPGHNLMARLSGDSTSSGGLGECWSALLELKSCTNEIVLFFLNGESYLGIDCCRAIRIITRDCWPTMLTSLGFTSQEGDILRGYCDASPSSHVQPPVQAPDNAPPIVMM